MTATTLEARDFSPSPSLDDSDPSSRTNQREYTWSKSSGRASSNPELGDSIEHEESNPTHLATGPPHPRQKANRRDLDDQCDNSLAAVWLNFWKIRNEDRHGRDDDTRRQARDNQTIPAVAYFYDEHATRVTPTLQWLFEIPLTIWIQGNICTLRIWLSTWKHGNQ
jgi:hypothetical protein